MPVIDPHNSHTAYPEPDASWVFKCPDRIVAFGFGTGLIRPAPGTWGTLLGWLLWILVVARLPDVGIAITIAVAFALGCWVCQRVGKEMGRPDHGGMVWDEIVAF